VSPDHTDRGVALILVLIATMALSAFAAGLVVSMTTDVMITGGFRAAQEASYTADAALEWALWEVARREDWSALLAAGRPSIFTGPGAPPAPPVNVEEETTVLERSTGTGNRRRWRLLASGWLSGVTGRDAEAAYLVVWVSDDSEDGDNDPATDTNDVVVIRAHGYGPRETCRSVEAVVARTPRPASVADVLPVRILRWYDPAAVS
jgi:hypothetical protein